MAEVQFATFGDTWRAEYGEINNIPLFRFGYKGDFGWEYTAPVAWLSPLIAILEAVAPVGVDTLVKGEVFQARKRNNLHSDVVVEPRTDTAYPVQYFDLYSSELSDLISTLNDLSVKIPIERPDDWDGTDRATLEAAIEEFNQRISILESDVADAVTQAESAASAANQAVIDVNNAFTIIDQKIEEEVAEATADIGAIQDEAIAGLLSDPESLTHGQLDPQMSQVFGDPSSESRTTLDGLYLKGDGVVVMEGDGIDPTGATNSAPAMQAFLDALPARSKTDINKGQVSVVLRPGLYRLDSTLKVDMFKSGLIAPWLGVTLDFRNIPEDTVGVHLWSSTQGNASAFVGGDAPSPLVSMYGIKIQGPRGSGSDSIRSGTVGIYLHADGNGISGNHKIEACTSRGFDTGVLLRDHAYCLTFDQVLIHRNRVGFAISAGLNDSGERLNIINSTVYGNSIAITNSDDCRWHCANSSFDYNKQVFVQGSNGVGFFRDCHFEQYLYRSDMTNPWFETQGGSIVVEGGIVAFAATGSGTVDAATPFLVRNDTDPQYCSNVIFNRTRVTGAVGLTTDFLAGGTGATEFNLLYTGTLGGAGQSRPLGSRAANLVVDGGASAQPSLLDEWVTRSGSATATATTGKTWNGNYSFRLSTGTVSCVVPITPGRSYGARLRAAYATAPTSNVVFRFEYVKMVNGSVTKAQTIISRTYAPSDLTNNFDTSVLANGGYVPMAAPGWATHYAITAVIPSSGSIFVTELLVTPR